MKAPGINAGGLLRFYRQAIRAFNGWLAQDRRRESNCSGRNFICIYIRSLRTRDEKR